MNSRMRKHAALAVVTLAAAGALTLARKRPPHHPTRPQFKTKAKARNP